MTMRIDLVAFLSAHPGLAAIQGDRLYPHILGQTPTLPASTYFVVDGTSNYGHDRRIHFRRWRVQFDCYAELDANAQALADMLEDAMHSLHFSFPRYEASLESRQDIHEPEFNRYRVSTDFMVEEE